MAAGNVLADDAVVEKKCCCNRDSLILNGPVHNNGSLSELNENFIGSIATQIKVDNYCESGLAL